MTLPRSRLLAAVATVGLLAGAAHAQAPMRPAQTPSAPATPATPPTSATPAPATPPPALTTPTSPATTAGSPPPADAQATAATPPADASAAVNPPSGAAFTALTPAPGADLPGVLTASGQFTTLLKAATATNLAPVLKTPGITVFAPTDAAFAALPAGQLDTLMKPENLPQLQKLLTYHVVNAKIPGIKGHAATPVTTASGQKVTLDGTGAQVKVNDASTLQPAVSVAGGATIYVIDKVLSPDYVPPPAAATPAASDTAEAPKTTSEGTTTRTVRKKKK